MKITYEMLREKCSDKLWNEYWAEFHEIWEKHNDRRDQAWAELIAGFNDDHWDRSTDNVDKLIALDNKLWQIFKRKDRYLIRKFYAKAEAAHE